MAQAKAELFSIEVEDVLNLANSFPFEIRHMFKHSQELVIMLLRKRMQLMIKLADYNAKDFMMFKIATSFLQRFTKKSSKELFDKVNLDKIKSKLYQNR